MPQNSTYISFSLVFVEPTPTDHCLDGKDVEDPKLLFISGNNSHL